MSAWEDDTIPCGDSCWAEDGDDQCVCGVGTEEGTRPHPAWDWRPVAGDPMADIAAMYAQLKDLPPVEPIHLTRPQMDWLRARLPDRPKQPYGIPDQSPLLGTPIYIVATVEESTPYVKCWTGWPTELLRRAPWWRRLLRRVGAS